MNNQREIFNFSDPFSNPDGVGIEIDPRKAGQVSTWEDIPITNPLPAESPPPAKSPPPAESPPPAKSPSPAKPPNRG